MASQVRDAAWLAWIERLVGVSAAYDERDHLPASLFHCCLDDQPDHLVPERLLRPGHWEVPSDRPPFLNPTCSFTSNQDAVCTDGFAADREMVWITQSGTAVLQPFWLGPETRLALAGVNPGDPAPELLSVPARRALTMANVLVPDDHDFRARKQWEETVLATSARFQQKGYAAVGGLIHPFHISALRCYYRHQVRTGNFSLGDSQSPARYVAYDDPIARFFHGQLASSVSAIAGEPVKPSYVYLASYQPGAVLEKHTDREQCEFSITFCVDYGPEPRIATPWPLHLHTQSGVVTVYQAIGDALLYRGRKIPHSRGALPAGHTSTSIFFHYVREDFAGRLD